LLCVVLGFLTLAANCPGLIIVVATLAHPVPRTKVARKVAAHRAAATGLHLTTFATCGSDSIVVIAARTKPVPRTKIGWEVARGNGVGKEA